MPIWGRGLKVRDGCIIKHIFFFNEWNEHFFSFFRFLDRKQLCVPLQNNVVAFETAMEASKMVMGRILVPVAQNQFFYIFPKILFLFFSFKENKKNPTPGIILRKKNLIFFLPLNFIPGHRDSMKYVGAVWMWRIILSSLILYISPSEFPQAHWGVGFLFVHRYDRLNNIVYFTFNKRISWYFVIKKGRNIGFNTGKNGIMLLNHWKPTEGSRQENQFSIRVEGVEKRGFEKFTNYNKYFL